MAGETEDQLLGDLKKQIGGNLDTATQNLLGYEFAAQTGRQTAPQFANDQYNAFQGMWVPSNMDEDSWNAAVTAAYQFSQNTDFRLMPSWNQVVNLYENSLQTGISLSDPRQVANFFAPQMPADAASKMPWAASGMNYTNWNSQIQSIGDWYQQQTGQRPSGSDLAQIQSDINAGHTSTQIQENFLNSKTFQQQYGWTKYGISYDTFQQQYKNNANYQQQVVARFGSGAIGSDQAYLNILATPTQGVTAQYASQQQSQRIQTNNAGMSDVR